MQSSVDDQIPIYELSDVGRQLANQLTSKGHQCKFVVRAPGRVNLIGEHIDYNGYAVLPMALEQAVHIAVANNSDATLVLSSTEEDYESVTVPVSEAVKFGSDGPPETVKWYHYFLCAYHGIADYANEHKLSWNPPGLIIHVGGARFGGLWPAAGLSSSSAFVVASAIAVMQVAGVHIGRRELAGLCVRCERYIGMQGGGMDQTTSLLGSQNNAILIEFTKPLPTIHPVPLPPDVVFVIAHCGVHARKAATSMYNKRVSECRLATKLLIHDAPNVSCIDTTRPAVLADAQHAWALKRPGDMVRPTGDGKQSIVSAHLRPGVYTLTDLVGLGLSKESIDFCLTPTTKTMTEFHLYDRTNHVYTEAERVWAFYELCTQAQSGGDNRIGAQLAQKLGDLMNASQQSCAELYDCSCEELNKLIKICRAAGALGSRLTGAGWGGCAVSLVPSSLSEKFIERVVREYYEPRGVMNATDGLIFVSQPGPPAGLMFSDRSR